MRTAHTKAALCTSRCADYMRTEIFWWCQGMCDFFPVKVYSGYVYDYGYKLGLHAGTSGVAPAPCSAGALPCLDVCWGEPLFVQRVARFAGLHTSGTHGRCRARESTVWYCRPPLALGGGREWAYVTQTNERITVLMQRAFGRRHSRPRLASVRRRSGSDARLALGRAVTKVRCE